MKTRQSLRRGTLVVSMLLIAVVGCQKKLTKVTQPLPTTPPPEASAPAPAPVIADTTDSASFRAAQLAGELAKEAKEALQNVYFDFDKYDLKPAATDRLNIIGKFMLDHGALRLLIAGNCDERGSAEYNIGLGERRAKTSRDFLTSYGVAANRIETTSYGKERLAEAGCTEDACHAKNRRDEFSVLEGELAPQPHASTR